MLKKSPVSKIRKVSLLRSLISLPKFWDICFPLTFFWIPSRQKSINYFALFMRFPLSDWFWKSQFSLSIVYLVSLLNNLVDALNTRNSCGILNKIFLVITIILWTTNITFLQSILDLLFNHFMLELKALYVYSTQWTIFETTL